MEMFCMALIQMYNKANKWSSKAGHFLRRYEQENNTLNSNNITSIGVWVGLALIALCWVKVIPLIFGWGGVGIALPSFIVEAINKKNMPPFKSDDK